MPLVLLAHSTCQQTWEVSREDAHRCGYLCSAAATDRRTILSVIGRIFNLNNTVPSDVGSAIKAQISELAIAVNQSLVAEPNRSLAQTLLDVAGPSASAGLMNCSGLANGWIHDSVLSDDAKSAVLDVHARQWGGAGRDK